MSLTLVGKLLVSNGEDGQISGFLTSLSNLISGSFIPNLRIERLNTELNKLMTYMLSRLQYASNKAESEAMSTVSISEKSDSLLESHNVSPDK